ncbi:MAG: phage tail protein [Desulfuromonadaceae bacterium]|nr:phage tail protein [Desulfuromonadaceae bacterium]
MRILLSTILIFVTTIGAYGGACEKEEFEYRLSGNSVCLLMKRYGTTNPATMVVWLHGNISSGGPANYHFPIAQKFATDHASENVKSVALVRPGYREGTHPLVLQRLAGLERFGVITLKTGVTKSLELSNWYQNFSSNPSPEARRNASIIVLNSKGEDGARFNLVNAWPAKYSVGPLEAKGKDVLYESLEIVFEGLQRVS